MSAVKHQNRRVTRETASTQPAGNIQKTMITGNSG
jgi:hypothetical protein